MFGRRRGRRRYKICVCGDWMDAVYCVLFEVGGGGGRGECGITNTLFFGGGNI